MQLTPEQAAFMAQGLIADVEEEAKTTRKVLAAVPDQGSDYRPDPKSRTGFDLAKHIATSEVWFLNGIAAGSFDYEAEAKEGAEITKPSEIPAYYDAALPAGLDKVRALTPEQLAKPVEFFGMVFPNVMYLTFVTKHSIHHRGQLSAYLRAMGGQVPSIYGGSADEPWQADAAQA